MIVTAASEDRLKLRPFVAVSPAKLNLFLEIAGKRPDGYHGIETLMIAVDLFDTLEFVPTGERSVRLSCNDETLPLDGRNLVCKAVNKLLPNAGIDITLTKRIPSEAGMGGGSGNAAITLQAVNRIFGLNRTLAELNGLAAELGSDIGFFLTPGAAWCTGRGEIVEPVEVGGPFHFVVVKPPVVCPTAEVYRRVTVPTAPISGDEARQALKQGDPERLAGALFNRLQEPAFAVAPAVRTVYETLKALKPLAVQVTGSGSAVFALCKSRDDAIRVAREYPKSNERVFVLRGLDEEFKR